MNHDLNLADEQLVDAWLASGLNRAAFARQQEMPYQHLLAAIRRVEQRSPSTANAEQPLTLLTIVPARTALADGPPFMVTAAATGGPAGAAGVKRTAAPALVLRWGSGVEMTVDARTGERIVRGLLAGGWPC